MCESGVKIVTKICKLNILFSSDNFVYSELFLALGVLETVIQC